MQNVYRPTLTNEKPHSRGRKHERRPPRAAWHGQTKHGTLGHAVAQRHSRKPAGQHGYIDAAGAEWTNKGLEICFGPADAREIALDEHGHRQASRCSACLAWLV